jgi:signal transduction histidine kinase
MLGFLAFSGFIIALGEANRRSLSRAQLGEEGVRKSHAELEQKVHERMAELRIANENLRELSGRLQQLRDEERRQIGRELHDSVGQMLAALAMNIGIIQTLAPSSTQPLQERFLIVQVWWYRCREKSAQSRICCIRLCWR